MVLEGLAREPSLRTAVTQAVPVTAAVTSDRTRNPGCKGGSVPLSTSTALQVALAAVGTAPCHALSCLRGQR